MVEYMMVISQYRFGLYNTQIDKLFNWIHGNNVGTLHTTSVQGGVGFCRDVACNVPTGFIGYCRDLACNVPTTFFNDHPIYQDY
jgi:hypothetical protein